MSGDQVRFDAPLPDLWDDAHAAGLDEPGLLLYRSNLLGSDLRITNFGGGNTSAKLDAKDPLTGEPVEVLWVKGSGGDLGSMKLDGFATLYLDKLAALKTLYRGLEHEDEMVGYLPHCTFNLNPRAASIDTPLHAFAPLPPCRPRPSRRGHRHRRVRRTREALTKEIYGDEIGWLPWQRPGFELGLKLGAMARANPNAIGVVLGSHGLFTWGRRPRRTATRPRCASSTRRSRWLAAKAQRSRPSAAPRVEALAARRAARCCGAADAGDPRPDRPRASARSATSTMRRRCWSSSIPSVSRRWRRSAPPAPIISCAPRSARWCCPRSDLPRSRRGDRHSTRRRRLPRRLCRLLRALQAARQSRRCAIPTRSSTSCPASA